MENCGASGRNEGAVAKLLTSSGRPLAPIPKILSLTTVRARPLTQRNALFALLSRIVPDMPTDHQINEQRPSRAQRQGGMLITGLIVLLVLAFGIWWLAS
jgi:hypothetical protein